MQLRASLIRAPALALLAAGALQAQAASKDDWPVANRTLKGDRFAPQDAFTPSMAGALVEVCRYDLGRRTNFQTGPIVVGGTMYLITDFDTVAIDADDCSEIWRTTSPRARFR